ncbi:MAG TPA: electron transfer flavoprotein subunit alpha/FixB family protein, partial [Anaerolineales bacterium]
MGDHPLKALLVCEYQRGKLLASTYELLAFADRLGVDKVMLLIGSEAEAPNFGGKLYLADAGVYGEYNPDVHKQLVLETVQKEHPDYIVFVHSSYGWDLAPRVAAALKVTQISEIVGVMDGMQGKFEVSSCNSKMRRLLTPKTAQAVLTIQAGAFTPQDQDRVSPQFERIALDGVTPRVEFIGYEAAEKKDVDLAKAEVIISAGRGIGKKENVETIAALARALGGELGATRPVVDAGWVEHTRQVGSSGQTVAPRLYVACGISGAIQHIAGMKKSDFIVAINKDKDAP